MYRNCMQNKSYCACNNKCNDNKEEDLIEDLDIIDEDLGSSVEIISTETEEGSQLYRAFGGIGAILRYNVR